jgi:hypothetical protein
MDPILLGAGSDLEMSFDERRFSAGIPKQVAYLRQFVVRFCIRTRFVRFRRRDLARAMARVWWKKWRDFGAEVQERGIEEVWSQGS